jgi:predicted alpha/beta hydrolase family esterase
MHSTHPLLWLGDDPAHARSAGWSWQLARAHGAREVMQHTEPVPLRGDWLVQLESAVRSAPRCRLIAQGLGCALVAAWAAYSSSCARVESALLLSPFCPEATHPSGRYRTWRAVTPSRLPFPACVIPEHSPRSQLSQQAQWAECWGAQWTGPLDPGGQREAILAWLQEPATHHAFL